MVIDMTTEIEAKFPNAVFSIVREKLLLLKAQLIHSEIFMRRCVFDFPGQLLGKKGGWVRVRDEGEKITLSYKELQSRTLHGTKEVTVDVSDFEKTNQLLKEIGLHQDSYQETKREKWLLNGCEVTLDTWPWIPPFVEIEGESEELVRKTALELGFDWSTALFGSVEPVYQQHYCVTDEEIDAWPEIRFIPVPKWLEEKRIK